MVACLPPCALRPPPAHVQAKKSGLHVKKLSGTKFRQMLRSGGEIPEWFAFKSVVQVRRRRRVLGLLVAGVFHSALNLQALAPVKG